jgi:hypothetical protein
MDFRAQYLQAMRDQDPAEFKRLSRNGMLEPQSRAVAKQASRMKEELLKDAPRDKYGQVSLQAEREAEEMVRADLLDFPASRTTPQEDEQEALQSDHPLTSPE